MKMTTTTAAGICLLLLASPVAGNPPADQSEVETRELIELCRETFDPQDRRRDGSAAEDAELRAFCSQLMEEASSGKANVQDISF